MSDPAFAERFLRESRVTSSLSHPNIVTVHDYFEHDGTPYISMEYIERGWLRPLVGKMTFAQVCGVLEGLLAGLQHAAGATAATSHQAPPITAATGPRAHRVDRMQERQRQQRISGHAVLELNRQRIVEQIAPPRLLEEQPRRGWNEGAVDLGPGVVDPARAQARDQRAEIELQEGQSPAARRR